jgi:uncharacterized RmlC-like cupin family protein
MVVISLAAAAGFRAAQGGADGRFAEVITIRPGAKTGIQAGHVAN